jgi:hypothetical protein
MPGPLIKLTGFIGEQPRVIPRLMPEMAAQSAVNTRLDDGALTPIRRSVLIHDITDEYEGAPKTIYLYGEDWLSWETAVHAVPGSVATDRLYYTGDGVPKLRVGEDVYDLAVPRPPSALTGTPDGAGSGDVTDRIYVYTWVTSLGEESEPSPASAVVEFQPGDDVVLSGFSAIPSGRAIATQRIYRSQTGQIGTGLYLIAERAATTADFTDDIPPEQFGELLPSTDWNAPPDTLAGLVQMPNGMMAGFVGKDIYFCEPYHPHAWPEKYTQAANAPIVALGALGSTLVVLTEAHPHVFSGAMPESMQGERLDDNLPCINARGVVDLGYMLAYPSHEGLVTVTPTGATAIATVNIFTRRKWLDLNPASMVGAQMSGRYVAFYTATGLAAEVLDGMMLIDISSQSFLVRAAPRGIAAFHQVETGNLYYVEEGTRSIYQYDTRGAARLNQYWKSKEFVLPYAENFGALRIDADAEVTQEDVDASAEENAAILIANAALIADDETAGAINELALNEVELNGDYLQEMIVIEPSVVVSVFADKVLIATVTKTNSPERLPGGYKARTWEVAVYGTARVDEVRMARTVDELKRVP